MKSIFVILSAIISIHGISGYSTHEYQRYVAKNVNGYATVEGMVAKDGVVKKFYKVIPEYSGDATPGDSNEFVFPDPVKIPEIKMPEFPHFQEPQIPVPTWNAFSAHDQANKLTQDIFEQNKKIQDSINANFINAFSSQPGFGNTFSSPVFGNTFSSQPVFANTFSQPAFNTFSSQPFNTFSAHPGFDNTFSTQPDFYDAFTPQFDYNAANTVYLPEYPQFNYWL